MMLLKARTKFRNRQNNLSQWILPHLQQQDYYYYYHYYYYHYDYYYY